MTKIAKSLAMIAFVAAIGVYATSSFFSDTETSVDNTFTAGTIDIDIDGHNPFIDNFDIGDLKPGEVGYINFRINNVGENPVDVSKKLHNFEPTDVTDDTSVVGYPCPGTTGLATSLDYTASSEPECVREIELGARHDDVETKILYDLSVEVYDDNGAKIWWQTIYAVDGTDDKSLEDVYGIAGTTYVDLGMIPVDGYMLVTQSYHFDSEAGNEYQGDGLTFDMEIYGVQLTGENGMATVTLENKTYSDGAWVINSGDGIVGTLEYETNGPEFVYNFSGVAPLASHNYVLAIGMKPNGAGFDVDTTIVNVLSDGSGVITPVSGSIELNEDMMGVKAWLVPAENWTDGTGMTGWTGYASAFLWETSFVWYNDTDI